MEHTSLSKQPPRRSADDPPPRKPVEEPVMMIGSWCSVRPWWDVFGIGCLAVFVCFMAVTVLALEPHPEPDPISCAKAPS